jgi:hypothetical protein
MKGGFQTLLFLGDPRDVIDCGSTGIGGHLGLVGDLPFWLDVRFTPGHNGLIFNGGEICIFLVMVSVMGSVMLGLRSTKLLESCKDGCLCSPPWLTWA